MKDYRETSKKKKMSPSTTTLFVIVCLFNKCFFIFYLLIWKFQLLQNISQWVRKKCWETGVELMDVRIMGGFVWESISDGSMGIQKQFELLQVRAIVIFAYCFFYEYTILINDIFIFSENSFLLHNSQ